MPPRASRAPFAPLRPAVPVGIALALGLAGCAPLGPGPGRAERLLDEAAASVREGDLEAAYYRLKELHTRYPDSAEDGEAFAAAAYCLKRLYHRHRFRDPESVWLNEEKRFVFDWLAARLDAGAPGKDARALFVGLPYSAFQSFQEHVRGREPAARWEVRAAEDNGIIREVTVVEAAPERADGQGG